MSKKRAIGVVIGISLLFLTLSLVLTRSVQVDLPETRVVGAYGPVGPGTFINLDRHASRVLVTGAAGFIGMHLCERLHRQGIFTVGIDDFNSYYSPSFKRARAARLQNLTARDGPGGESGGVQVIDGDVCNRELVSDLLHRNRITHVVHLAAQAGVRYSIPHPQAYVRNNVECFVELLEVLVAIPPNANEGVVSSTKSVGLASETAAKSPSPLSQFVNYFIRSSAARNTEIRAVESGQAKSPRNGGNAGLKMGRRAMRFLSDSRRLVAPASSSDYSERKDGAAAGSPSSNSSLIPLHISVPASHVDVSPGGGSSPAYTRPYLVYASSSSVYGLNQGGPSHPFKESDRVDRPSNLYGATKRMNEHIALAYHNLHGLRSVGCRFFTVYGPWGRPDMAMYKFTEAIEQGKPLTLFNGGKMARDFTYVDDVVDGLVRVLEWRAPFGEPQVFNLGNSQPVELRSFVRAIEGALNKEAVVVDGGPSKGEVPATFADSSLAQKLLGFKSSVSIEVGATKFAEWYRSADRRAGFEQVAS